MADNVQITAGSGTTIATDEVGTDHYQKFKLHTSEADSAEGIGDDDKGAARALWVAPRPDVVTAQQDSSGLTTATTAYTAGDVLGAGWTFTSAAKATGGVGRILAVSLLDVADIVQSVTLHVFSGSVTFGTDNSAPSVSDGDAAKWLGSIPLAYQDLGGARVFGVDSMALPYVCDATSLYVYAVTNVDHTFFGAASDLKLRLFLQRD